MTPRAQPRLSGEGVVLRPFRDDDADVVIAAGRDPLIPAMSTVTAGGDVHDARRYVLDQLSRAATGTGWSYAIADGDDVAVGQVGLGLLDDGRAMVGYWVAEQYRRRGYAGRALRVFTEWAVTLPDVERLELYVEPENEASWRAAESAHYCREGLLRRWQRVAGESRDMYMYAFCT
ncbi:GNAT family N-acetyltransferase [Mycobacterium yunnanensis]|uniref:GNAT family N-acetyltransferase n=1 Tax=Mycobacterium yunnanensis TaxID=368477 RepID=A0A9X2Z1W9_9MYCO|nr:GNAT family N-acetyltransferase [Mycobacterium yunnanensis]